MFNAYRYWEKKSPIYITRGAMHASFKEIWDVDTYIDIIAHVVIPNCVRTRRVMRLSAPQQTVYIIT